MQELQKYETTLIQAASVDSPELRWSIFANMTAQICRDIQAQGRSLFYERCLSCYHNGMTPSGQKLSPGWFSRSALNIVFAVNYLLRDQAPQFLRSVMMTNLGPLNNILRDSPAIQSVRYNEFFRGAQNYYDARLRRVLAAAEAAAAGKQDGCKANLIPPVKHSAEQAARCDKSEQTLEAAFAAQFSGAKDEPAAAEQAPAEGASHASDGNAAPAKAEASAQDETTPAAADAEAGPSIPDLLLPLLEENRSALHEAIRAQKQVGGEIEKALAALGNPFSQGAVFQRQLLSALDALVTHQEECNRILLGTLSDIENALGAAQWEGFAKIAALLDEFNERHHDPERRRTGAMWGDMRAIRQRYLNQLYRQGIEPIVPAPGDAFDEDLHELSPDADIDLDDAARITRLYYRGYRMGDAVFLRAVVDADDAEPTAE